LPLAVLTGLALAAPGPVAADGHRPRTAPHQTPAPPPLPPTVRGPVEPEPSAVPDLPADTLPQIAPPPRYRLLREGDAQCLAAQSAWLANLLDRERAQLAAAHPPPHSDGHKLFPSQWNSRA